MLQRVLCVLQIVGKESVKVFMKHGSWNALINISHQSILKYFLPICYVSYNEHVKFDTHFHTVMLNSIRNSCSKLSTNGGRLVPQEDSVEQRR